MFWQYLFCENILVFLTNYIQFHSRKLQSLNQDKVLERFFIKVSSQVEKKCKKTKLPTVQSENLLTVIKEGFSKKFWPTRNILFVTKVKLFDGNIERKWFHFLKSK